MTQTAPPAADGTNSPPRRPGVGAVLRGTALAVAGAIILVVLLTAGLALSRRGEAIPGVTVAGVDVGGQSRDEVTAALTELTTARQHDPIVFTYGDDRYEFVPGEETYEADLEAAVTEVMAAGRSGDVLRAGLGHLSTLWTDRIDVRLPDDVHAPAVHRWVREIADAVDTPAFIGEVTADPDTLAVRTRMPADGVRVRRQDAVDLALDAIREPGPVTRELPTEVVERDVPDEAVDELAGIVRRALEGPLVLTANDGEIVLEPSEFAGLIRTRAVRADDGQRALAVHVRGTGVDEVLSPHRDLLDRAPREARFEVRGGLRTFDDMSDTSWSPTDAEVEVIPSEDGTELDAVLAAAQIADLINTGRREAALRLMPVRPELSTDEARSLGITDLIGTFTTYHPCCRNRVRNIQRMADIVRGAVIRPGETFSINEHVGRRTVANGFVADGTIVGGEYVDEVGGGVSQFATTMYNAAFFAGLQIPEHKAHSYYISRYPMGREATLYYPSVDLKVRNDTDRGVLVHTSYTGTSITVSIFGDNGGLNVSATHGSPTNYRSHRTIYRENKSLPPGASRVVQQGGRGFDVTVTRTLRRPDGDERSERIFTRYQPPLEIIERNTSPRPRPSPSPSPTPTSPSNGGDDGGGGGGGSSGGGGNGDNGGGGGEEQRPSDEG